jgi:hypothetical protein
MRGGAWGLNTPLNAGLKEGKAKGHRDLAGADALWCGAGEGNQRCETT